MYGLSNCKNACRGGGRPELDWNLALTGVSERGIHTLMLSIRFFRVLKRTPCDLATAATEHDARMFTAHSGTLHPMHIGIKNSEEYLRHEKTAQSTFGQQLPFKIP